MWLTASLAPGLRVRSAWLRMQRGRRARYAGAFLPQGSDGCPRRRLLYGDVTAQIHWPRHGTGVQYHTREICNRLFSTLAAKDRWSECCVSLRPCTPTVACTTSGLTGSSAVSSFTHLLSGPTAYLLSWIFCRPLSGRQRGDGVHTARWGRALRQVQTLGLLSVEEVDHVS